MTARRPTCRDLIEFLDDYLDERLEPEVRAPFEAHLADCPPCRDYLRTYEETIRLSRSLCEDEGGPAPPEVPEELIEAVLEARRRESGTGRGP